MKENDIIRLKKDIVRLGLKKGQKGAIVAPYDKSKRSVLVEFADHKGRTIAIESISIDDAELFIEYNYK